MTVETLITPRLRLRPFFESDRDALLALEGDPAVMRYFGNGEALIAAQVDLVLEAHIHCRQKYYWAWAVCLKDDPTCMGVVTAVPVDWHFDQWVELTWMLIPKRWKVGFATEAVKAVIAHGIKDLGWRDILAGARVENAPSLRVMAKCGMSVACDEPDERGRVRRVCTIRVPSA